ncbi:MAG: ArsR/SmtB family transcription factor [Candidatus Dormibacteria bacterium]
MSSVPPTEEVHPLRHVLSGATPAEWDLATYFEGLGNPTRLRILARLAQVKQARVSDVALLLGISQPRMSWHLRLLRRARIVVTKREGREVFCRLDRDSIAANLQRFQALVGGEADTRTDAVSLRGSADAVNQPLPSPGRERSLPEVI